MSVKQLIATAQIDITEREQWDVTPPRTPRKTPVKKSEQSIRKYSKSHYQDRFETPNDFVMQFLQLSI